MTQRISVKYRGPKSSKDINSTVYDLIGRKNGMLSGFEVVPKNNLILNIQPGVLYIKGSRIEQEDSVEIIVSPNTSPETRIDTIYAYYEYGTIDAICTYHADQQPLSDSCCKIATVSILPNATEIFSENIVMAEYISIGSGGGVSGDYIPTSEKGAPYGVASLNGEGKVSSTHIPKASESNLGAIRIGDNVSIDVDGYISVEAHPESHDPSIILQDSDNRFVSDVEKDTWNSKSDLSLGETLSTAYRGDRGKVAYDHSQLPHNYEPKNENIQSHISNIDNPHNITKGKINLGDVENKSSATIRNEITSTNVITALGYVPINSTSKGANNGLAELDAAGKVPSSQLPSYVDDVLEYVSFESFPTTGETGKIYIAKDTNLTYRWGGTEYVEISSSLALGETPSTAYRGDRGKEAYEHSQSSHNYEPKNENIQSHISNIDNPHNITKAKIGLGSVEDYSIATQAESEEGISSLKYMTPLRVNQAIQALSPTGGGIVLGETSATAYRGDRGKEAYDHSQIAHQQLITDGEIAILATVDWDNYTSAGFYRGYNLLNQPTGAPGQNSNMYVSVIAHDSFWCVQTATDFNNKATWTRSKAQGAWSPWIRLVRDDSTSIKLGKYEMVFNSTTNTLDFVYNG